MRILYGEEFTNEEIRTVHERLMREKLESWKLETAREIAERRLAGFPVRAHALTSEAMIAQQMANIKRVQTAFVEQKVNRDLATKAKERKFPSWRKCCAAASLMDWSSTCRKTFVRRLKLMSGSRTSRKTTE